MLIVFEDYVNELEGKPPSANSASQQVASSFPAISSKTTKSITPSSDDHSHHSTTSNELSIHPPSSTQQLGDNDHLIVSKQLSKISEKTSFVLEDEKSNGDETSFHHQLVVSNNSTSSSNNTSNDRPNTTQQDSQLPFGRYLTVKNGKITVVEDYLRKDNGKHFLRVIKKCEEVFPNDLKLGPNHFPTPENIHMLINYCTMNSELNIKKIMLKNAKKVLSNSQNHVASANSAMITSSTANTNSTNQSHPATHNTNNSSISNQQQQLINFFQQQQQGASATLTLGSSGSTTVLNNVNLQMVADPKHKGASPGHHVSSSPHTHLQVQVPPSVTITTSGTTSLNSKTTTGSTGLTGALVMSGSIDMTNTQSSNGQANMKVNGSIAMVHLGNVKDLIRGDSNPATVMLNHLHRDEDELDGNEVDEDEDADTDEDDLEDDEDEEDEDDGEDEDYDTEEDDDEEEEIPATSEHHPSKHPVHHHHSDEHYYKKKTTRAGRHPQTEEQTKEHEQEKNEILASNMRESKLLFQIYLARLFAHNIRVAYNDLCASEMQKCLLEEFERETKHSTPSKASKKKAKKHDKKKEEKPLAPSKSKGNKSVTPEKPLPVSVDSPSEDEQVPSEHANEMTEDVESSVASVVSEHYDEEIDHDGFEEEDDFFDNDMEAPTGQTDSWNVVTKKAKQKTTTSTTTSSSNTAVRGYGTRGKGNNTFRGVSGGRGISLSSGTTTVGTTTSTPSATQTKSKSKTVPSVNPSRPTPSFYSVSPSPSNNVINKPPPSSTNTTAAHQFHSQHVKATVPPTANTTAQPNIPHVNPSNTVNSSNPGFFLLPSAVNASNIHNTNKLTRHTRQTSGSSNGSSASLESPLHYVNTTPSANSTVSSIVSDLLNDDDNDSSLLGSLRRSSPTSTNSSCSAVSGSQFFGGVGTGNSLFDSSLIPRNNSPIMQQTSPRSNNSLHSSTSPFFFNPFEMHAPFVPQPINPMTGGQNAGNNPMQYLFGQSVAPPLASSNLLGSGSPFMGLGNFSHGAPQSQGGWSLFQSFGSISLDETPSSPFNIPTATSSSSATTHTQR